MIAFYKRFLVRLREWEAALSWALDMVKMYEDRLSEIDGEEIVRPRGQKQAIMKAQNAHYTLTKAIQSIEEETGN